MMRRARSDTESGLSALRVGFGEQDELDDGSVHFGFRARTHIRSDGAHEIGAKPSVFTFVGSVARLTEGGGAHLPGQRCLRRLAPDS